MDMNGNLYDVLLILDNMNLIYGGEVHDYFSIVAIDMQHKIWVIVDSPCLC